MKAISILFITILLALGSCKKASKKELRGEWNLTSATQEYTENYADGGFDRYTTTYDGTSAAVELYTVSYASGVFWDNYTYSAHNYSFLLSIFKETFKVDIVKDGVSNIIGGTWEKNRTKGVDYLTLKTSESVEAWEFDVDHIFTIQNIDKENMTISITDKESEPAIYMELKFEKVGN